MRNKILIWLLIAADIFIFLWSMYNVLVYRQQASNINVIIYLIICFVLSVNIGFLIKYLTVKKHISNQ
jgi:hypothetical protein